ncbi:MAG: tetratricopeptide repeat protein [Treponema sp.]|nr:tetratricopeptide repeat protein [Treponema sp.]
MKHNINDDTNFFKRKSKFVPNLITILCIIFVGIGISFSVYYIIRKKIRSESSVYTLYARWNNYDYTGVYETSKHILDRKPFNNTALTYHGYASFYLGVSQLETSTAQNYLDESINNLRIALISAKKSLKPQLEYMLGKAYFYKNTISSYYYADLAIKYLQMSKHDGYKADDIPEYLGLSYASLDMTLDSISAFTEALLVRESDTLLLSIAEQYRKAGQNAAAEQYLFRIINNCKDDILVLKSRVLLGTIYTDEGKYTDAEQEYMTVLEKNENSADVYYGLGVIYEKQGDLVKARSEWRKALRIQVNHPGALKKMTDYK